MPRRGHIFKTWNQYFLCATTSYNSFVPLVLNMQAWKRPAIFVAVCSLDPAVYYGFHFRSTFQEYQLKCTGLCHVDLNILEKRLPINTLAMDFFKNNIFLNNCLDP